MVDKGASHAARAAGVVEKRLGYNFTQRPLLERALTHRSFGADHNERLEFLGDAVLNLAVSRLLYDRFSGSDEGDLTRVRAHLVREDSLHRVALALHVPGLHNVLNAPAAVAIGAQLEIAPATMATALAEFRGVDRRFQLKGMARGVTVVDDYGHHPTEIRATLAAARDCGYKGVHVIFQPHRYSRTRDLMEEFATAFEHADSVEVLDIYAASEEPIPGITGDALAKTIQGPQVHYAGQAEEAIAAVAKRAQDGDLIMTLGAGSVSQVGPQVLEALGR